MRRRTLASSVVLVFLVLLFPAVVFGQSAGDRVEAALSEMHAWVGDGDKGQGWKRFLRSEELTRQLALGEEADPAVVEEILARYAGDTSGLDRERFVQVREALRVWLDELSIPSIPSPGELAALARAAVGEFTPITTERVEATRSKLNAALDRLERFLAGGPAEYASGWKRYLKWDVIQAQLSAEEGPDLTTLKPVLDALHANHTGLEREEFTSVRNSLRDYMNTVLYSSRPDLKSDYEGQIQNLAMHLDNYAQTPDTQTATEIGRILGWLEAGELAGDVVQAVRHHHWRPNAFARLSERLIAAGIEDDVEETSRVRQVILGTSISGTAHMTGRLGVQLIPDDQQASFRIMLAGEARSRNVGYNGPVTIYSNGQTQIQASKRVQIGAEGLTGIPAEAQCDTSSNITDISARMRLIERIAWRQAGRNKSRAESISSRIASRQVAGRMDRRAADMLDDANQNFFADFRAPLLRRDAFPQLLQFRTSDQHLFVNMLQVGRYQLAASGEPPELTADHDLALRLHESVVANLSESLLGGETLTDEKLVELLENADIQVPEELQITPDKDPWSITFAAEQPITAQFRSEGVSIAIRGRQFTRGSQAVSGPIDISAKYQLALTDEGAQLTRDGEVSVEYVDRPQLSVAQVAMKTFLRKKFEALFDPEINVPDLTLPGNWEKAGELRLEQLDSASGWLALGWAQLENLRTALKE